MRASVSDLQEEGLDKGVCPMWLGVQVRVPGRLVEQQHGRQARVTLQKGYQVL